MYPLGHDPDPALILLKANQLILNPLKYALTHVRLALKVCTMIKRVLMAPQRLKPHSDLARKSATQPPMVRHFFPGFAATELRTSI